MGFAISEDKIAEIDVLLDPQRLARLHPIAALPLDGRS
jgi:hypothetical protein